MTTKTEIKQANAWGKGFSHSMFAELTSEQVLGPNWTWETLPESILRLADVYYYEERNSPKLRKIAMQSVMFETRRLIRLFGGNGR